MTWSTEINDRQRQVQTDAVATEMAIDELRDEILKLLVRWPQGDGLRLKLVLEIQLPQFP